MKKPLDNFTVERLEEFIRQPLENGLTRSEQMELARIALVVSKAQKDAEQFGVGFIVCKPNELPRRADPTKVVLTFTDSGLGHEALI
ncbi:hypothetical protein ACRRQX_004120 [Yersinia enterocolitica]|uniref:hypothetical protein n=1 Tax=Yersinia enterocolitica TaxID=630 RepID=UPI00285FDDEE|nr:hypothetical protein [Yersinia enterocolitica]EKN4912689.1 hypothetical protein [Yersinia enterocolitica]EKN6039604.1 hypothetical protein [Yersinia enterocolitica]ELI8338192.1 hypothetical protein [Yersinia enterocolitica]ELW8193704.1 hypothetical protein [Yersinia enterocolitica]